MTSKFLAKYFPLAKSVQLKIEITTFKQQDYKLLYEAWERYKELLGKCPNHNFSAWEQIELFYNGLNGPTRIYVDAAAGGSIFAKFPVEAYEMLEQMTMDTISTQLAALTKENQNSTETASLVSVVNSANGFESVEQAQYVNNRNYNNYRDEGRSSLDDLVGNFIFESTKRFERTENRLDNMKIHLTNVGDSMKNLEIQIGQLANALTNQHRGYFSSNTEVNPIEQCKAVTLRIGKEVGVDEPKVVDYEDLVEEIEVESKESVSKNSSKSAVMPEKPPVPKAMPHYANFMNNVMTRKRKLEEFETVKLTEECSAILQKKLLQKLKDLGSFTVPCIIGDATVNRTLYDLGASINLMSLSIFRSLELGEVIPTIITLQLADRSLTYPRVLDMEETQDVPLILGRPFLATGRSLIDVQEGELTLRVGGEAVTFNIYKTTNYQDEVRACNNIDLFDSSVNNFGVGIELKSGRDPKVAKKVKKKTKSKIIFEYVWRVKERNKTSNKVTGIG
ncbi:uncharacterized protein [Henckelia pumila]|uniref:uncharacterized protein n=1 Tax=Henckelia pumila TaxID=405737 RepID=UPI003C6E66CA